MVFFVNVFTYFIKKDEYGVYEISGLIASVILIPFLEWNYSEHLIQNTIFLIVTIIGAFISETISNENINHEYSYTKLFLRGSVFVLLTLFMTLNIEFNIITSPAILVVLLFCIGYMFTSSCFQYFLLTRDENIDLESTD